MLSRRCGKFFLLCIALYWPLSCLPFCDSPQAHHLSTPQSAFLALSLAFSLFQVSCPVLQEMGSHWSPLPALSLPVG